MRRLWPLFLFITIFIAAILAKITSTEEVPQTSRLPNRIISLSPSITEIMFALGAENKLIAVSDFCDYPHQAESLPKVGGYLDPSLEKIVSLNPDLVILLANQQQTIEQLSQLHIPVLTIRNSTLEEIKSTIQQIASQLGLEQNGQTLLDKINSVSTVIDKKVAGLPKPRVLISIGRNANNTNFKQFYIAGQHDFYNDLIQLSGAQNAYQLDKPAVPTLSIEGLLALNPDIIIDIFPESDDHNQSISHITQQWYKLKHLKAVQNKQVHIIEEDYATIPGPRIFLLLQTLSPLIHPELDWQTHAKD